MCAPVAVSPCLSSPRTQRRIHSLRNKCGGEGGGEEHPAAEASSHGGKKTKHTEERRHLGQIHATDSTARHYWSVEGGQRREEV